VLSIAYASWVDARAEVDDELGLRLHWRKRAAMERGLLDREGRVQYLRGRTVVVAGPERSGALPAPVPESRVDLAPPVGV
jgi:hypothetical protein